MGIIISIYTIFIVYFGVAAFFIDHYYYGSEINGINVSGKSVSKVKEKMTTELQAYVLNLKELGDREEKIRADEIGLRFDPDGQFENFKNKQNPFKWIASFYYTQDFKVTIGISYEEKLLKETVDRLSCFDKINIIEPKNPILAYTDKGYIIVDEVNGNKVNKDALYGKVSDALLMREAVLDLKSAECYVKPQYTSKSQKVIEAKEMLNKYASSKITYTFGEDKEVLDSSVINKWLKVEDNYEITFDENKMRDYIDTLSNKHNTTGSIKNFATSSGGTININGGDYEWQINTKKEIQDLISAVKQGKSITKEPAYTKNAYVEIDLTKQHLWFYKNGSLVVEGDIVSGNFGGSYTTPGGVYRLKSAERNVVLRGPGYAAPVSFWMPFNGGIGIHDATWRSRFGGNIYKYDGSHGCINCPYNLAKTIYENIEVGTPVICYY